MTDYKTPTYPKDGEFATRITEKTPPAQIDKPLVTVVIPTRHRPILLKRALRSVMEQTFSNWEVVVVVDGPDEGTCEMLAGFVDSRVRTVQMAQSIGGGGARNAGVTAASGKWIALLDDDDEWMPQKLEVQLHRVGELGEDFLVIACQYIDRNGVNDMIRPQTFQKKGQPLSEYLFCTTSIFHPRQGFIQTSTLLAPKALLVQVPFAVGLKRNQDTDWLLNAVPQTGKEVHIIDQILTIFHNEKTPGRIGSTSDWEYTYRWAIDSKALFTCRALSSFLATICLGIVMKQPGPYKNALRLFCACKEHASITPGVIWLFIRNAVLAPTYRKLLPTWLITRSYKFIYR